MEFVQQRWNPAKTQCSQRNFGKKNPLKPKKIICVDLPIFRQDNYQNATNQLKLCFSQDRREICLKTLKYGRNARFLQNITPKLTKTFNSDGKHLFVFLQK